MIGKVISYILSNDADVVALVGTRIFPIIMETTTAIPACTYSVLSLEPTYSNSGWEYDEAKFNVTCIAKSYKDTSTLSFKIRKALELKHGTYSSVVIDYILMEGIAESYLQSPDDSFVQTLQFSVKINSYGSY